MGNRQALWSSNSLFSVAITGLLVACSGDSDSAGDDGGTSGNDGQVVSIDASESADAGPVLDAGPQGFDPESTDHNFYAVGYAGLYMKSEDLGVTWDVIGDDGSGGDDATLFRNVHWLGGLYLRVGNSGRGFWTSTDGESWIDHAEEAGLGQWIGGVAYGNGIWLAAGGCGVTMRSSNGSDWTNLYNAPGQEGCEHARTVAYGNGVFVTLGNNGSDAYSAVTTDGVTFTDYWETSEFGWHSVVFAFGQFWVAKNDGSEVMTSSDGATWAAATLPDHSFRRVSFTGNRLAITTSDGVMLVSTDGNTFNEIDAPALGRVSYGGGVWLGANGGNLQRSSDGGASWTSVNPTGHSVQRIIYAP